MTKPTLPTLIAVVLLLSWTPGTEAAPCPVRFDGEKFPTSGGSRSLASGDFDGDGWLDIATASNETDEVSVLLGQGDGTIALTSAIPIDDATLIRSADFDGDGQIDLVVTSSYGVPRGIHILLGNGDGTFQAPTAYPLATGPRELTIADFDGDSAPDLAAAVYGADSVVVLLGNGDGTFQTLPGISIPHPNDVASADLNRDGAVDLVVSRLPIASSLFPSFDVLLGVGDGTFQPPVRFLTSFGVFGTTLVDLRSDGIMDAVVSLSQTFEIWLGDGSGGFVRDTDYPGGCCYTAVDVDLDGLPDLQTGPGGDPVIFKSNPDGSLQPPLRIPHGGASALIVDDFDRDGNPDLATANYSSADVSILPGLGNGSFPMVSILPVGDDPQGVVSADLDLDGLIDVAVANRSLRRPVDTQGAGRRHVLQPRIRITQRRARRAGVRRPRPRRSRRSRGHPGAGRLRAGPSRKRRRHVSGRRRLPRR